MFGGVGEGFGLRSVMRYSIIDNAWELLPGMEKERYDHCAVAGSGSDIYIIGGVDVDDSFEILDTASLLCKTKMIPVMSYAVTVFLKDQYLVVIGGIDDNDCLIRDCLIYDIWSKNWSLAPLSMDMRTLHADDLTAAVLDGKVIVSGRVVGKLESEFVDIDELLEYVPLPYPLPLLVFNQILEIGKADDNLGGEDEHPCKKAKIVQSNY